VQAVQARGRVAELAAGSGPAVGLVVVDRSLFDLLTYQKFYGGFSYVPLIHLKGDVSMLTQISDVNVFLQIFQVHRNLS
jgi:hypothetical protein